MAAIVSYLGLLEPLDLRLYDLAVGWQQRPPNPAVTIVVVDDDALATLGRWPWSRRIHATLVRKLTAAGVRGIGIDILFNEVDDADPEGDRLLAEAIRDSGRVVLPVYPGLDQGGRLRERLPLPALRQGATLGHVDAELDADGATRGLFLYAGLERPRWPAFALALLQRDPPPGWYLPAAQRHPDPQRRAAGRWMRDRRVLIPFAGPPGHFSTLSYLDVLDRPVEALGLAGKWVLVGVIAAGIEDSLVVPAAGGRRLMSGVEFNANVLDALLAGRVIRPFEPWWTALLSLSLVLVPAVMAGRRGQGGLLSWSLFFVLAGALSLLLLMRWQLWFPPAAALLFIAFGLALSAWLRLGNRVREARLESATVRASLADLDDGLISADADGRIEYLNPAAERILGHPLERLRGRPLRELLTCEGNDAGDGLDPLAVTEGKVLRCRVVEQSVGVDGLWLQVRGVRDRTGASHGRVLTLRERPPSGELGGADDDLDPLTGLPGRSMMVLQLQQALSRAARSGSEVALLYIRLDRFRQISASMGFQALERLLCEVVGRIRNGVRGSDAVARNGSDEFIVVLDAAGGEAAARVGRELLETLTRPYTIDDQQVQLLVSIGIGISPHDGADAEELLKNAYTAAGEIQGRNGVTFFSRRIQRQTEQRRRLESDLSGALERDELELYFQPQVEVASGRMVAAEALLRWRRNDTELVSPLEFIPIAEESGLIHAIGAWVFDRACWQLADWRHQGLDVPRLAVNLSPVQLQQELTGMLVPVMERYGVPGELLELELTEGAIIQAMESACTTLSAFQELGGSVAVDDFGTGYSTFSYLRQLPVNRIKIDKSFIRDMTLRQDDDIIILSIISMARGLDLEVVAEGVEQPQQLELLRAHGCHLAQGYLFSPPLPADRFTALLKQTSGSPLPV